MPAGAQMKSRDLVLGHKSGHEVPVCTPFFFRSGAVQCFVLVAKLMFQNGVWQGELEYLDPGSQIVGMTRQWKARENMSAWSGKRDRAMAGKRKGERERSSPPFLSPVSSRFIFVFALSEFRGPDYFGAWNRLELE